MKNPNFNGRIRLWKGLDKYFESKEFFDFLECFN